MARWWRGQPGLPDCERADVLPWHQRRLPADAPLSRDAAAEDIFLGAHAEWFNYEQKRDRAKSEGVQAWVNPEEYRQFVAKQKRAFEDQVDLELAVKK